MYRMGDIFGGCQNFKYFGMLEIPYFLVGEGLMLGPSLRMKKKMRVPPPPPGSQRPGAFSGSSTHSDV